MFWPTNCSYAEGSKHELTRKVLLSHTPSGHCHEDAGPEVERVSPLHTLVEAAQDAWEDSTSPQRNRPATEVKDCEHNGLTVSQTLDAKRVRYRAQRTIPLRYLPRVERDYTPPCVTAA